MKKRFLLATLFSMGTSLLLNAQEVNTELNKESTLPEKNATEIEKIKMDLGKFGALKISGYVQAQWQYTPNEGNTPTGFVRNYGDAFSPEMNNRFGIRRGRIKFTYQKGPVMAVIQPDFTEKGIGIKDVYVNYEPFEKRMNIRMGLFDRPFGYEIEYSSSQRESAERSRTFLALFPGERDCGVKIQLKGANGLLSQFTLDAGLFNGNGIAAETNSHKDFIGKLAWKKSFSTTQLNAAFSFYGGAITGGTKEGENKFTQYTYYKNSGWEAKESKGNLPRQYYGLSARMIQYWAIGTTNLVGEVILGKQPSAKDAFANATGNSFNNMSELYLRDFRGGYVMLIQDIGSTRNSLVLKYDFFDPNTKIKGKEITSAQLGTAADIAYTTLSVGYLFRFNENLRLMAQYDFTSNEKLSHFARDTYKGNKKIPNILTLRAQVKF